MKQLSDYTNEATERCERALVTVLGNVGPWAQHIYLVGGLVPRYLIGELPEGARPHIGTTDVDLVISLSIDGEVEAYKTLERNLRDAGFTQTEPSFRWRREIDGIAVFVEFICDTDRVEKGRLFKPKRGAGSKLSAFNVSGAQLAAHDFLEIDLEAERLDGGGRSKVRLRVANILPFVVLKINAFQERHENKDAYDLIYCLKNYRDDSKQTGEILASRTLAHDDSAKAALTLLEERFARFDNDGPTAYANFLAPNGDNESDELRREAVAVVRRVLAGFRGEWSRRSS